MSVVLYKGENLNDYTLVQNEAIKSILELCWNNGEPYTNADGSLSAGTQIQFGSMRNGKNLYSRPKLLKEYLKNNLRTQTNLDKMIVSQLGVLYVEKIHKISDGKYEGTAHYLQIFRSEKDGKLLYDKTEKVAKCSFHDSNSIDEGSSKVYLGDIKLKKVSEQ